jgi:hypothetical protein
MTEQDARNLMYDLWENGEIPNNFDENHSDYEKAVRYTMKNGIFDIERFLEDNKIINFGVWQVESDALIGKVGYDYIIECSRFWETREYNGFLVWDWLIHLTTKSWFKVKDVNDFNTAFFFCQDYFKEHKPVNSPYVSTAQTLYIQKQLMQIRQEMLTSEKFDKNGTFEVDIENMLKYRDLKSNLKFL